MKKIFLAFSLLLVSNLQAASMRDCAILPITDTAGDALGVKIYERLEQNLKEEKWCRYKSSSDVMGILAKYRDNLERHLENKIVLKTIAQRLNVGSLIKVGLNYNVDQVEVELKVYSESGEDQLFGEVANIPRIDEDRIFSKIKSWLEIYERTIPYDGKVLGILGNQITFSVHRKDALSVGQDFEIRRVIGKKKHPLLKKVVEWDSILLAKGKISNLASGQLLGAVKVYTNEKKVREGDWVIVQPLTMGISTLPDDKRSKSFKEGSLGEVTLGLGLSSVNIATSPSAGNIKYGGYIYGIDLEVEAWVTRDFFALGRFDRRIGTPSVKSGDADSDETGLNAGSIKVGGGFKYLPLGFFYGPQINAYTGWVNYGYEVDSSDVDGIGTVNISGIMVGAGANIPLQKGLRVFARGEVIPFADVSDEDNVYGSNKNVSSLLFNLGMRYQLNPMFTLVGSFESLSNTMKFKGSNSELAFRESMFKVSTMITF